MLMSKLVLLERNTRLVDCHDGLRQHKASKSRDYRMDSNSQILFINYLKVFQI